MTPVREQDISTVGTGAWVKARSFPGRGQNNQPGSTIKHISYGIVSEDAISFATTTHLVVSKGISHAMTLRAGLGIIVQRDA